MPLYKNERELIDTIGSVFFDNDISAQYHFETKVQNRRVLTINVIASVPNYNSSEFIENAKKELKRISSLTSKKKISLSLYSEDLSNYSCSFELFFHETISEEHKVIDFDNFVSDLKIKYPTLSDSELISLAVKLF